MHFMGDEDIKETDAKIVSIKNIIDLDNSINDLPPLEQGHRAVRLQKNNSWEIYQIVD